MLDVFTMRVGNLPPGSSVTLSLTYATQVRILYIDRDRY
jgi:hypothetical protein